MFLSSSKAILLIMALWALYIHAFRFHSPYSGKLQYLFLVSLIFFFLYTLLLPSRLCLSPFIAFKFHLCPFLNSFVNETKCPKKRFLLPRHHMMALLGLPKMSCSIFLFLNILISWENWPGFASKIISRLARKKCCIITNTKCHIEMSPQKRKISIRHFYSFL